MVIYEVNLTVNHNIRKEFYSWLIEHIKMILKFSGFQQAELAEELSQTPDTQQNTQQTKYTVRYLLDNEQSLEHYLKNHAPSVREDGIKKFGDQFSVTRRFFKEPNLMFPAS